MNRLSKREREMIHSFWGQLIDLSCGQIKELVITDNNCADLLRRIIQERLQEEKILDKAEAEDSRAEERREEVIQSPKDEPDSYKGGEH